MSKAAEKEAQPSVDMEALQKKKLEDTTFADLVRAHLMLHCRCTNDWHVVGCLLPIVRSL